MSRFDIGIVVKMEEETPERLMSRVHEMGFSRCQISVYNPKFYSEKVVTTLKEQCSKYNIIIDGIWTGWPGVVAWNFTEGPTTVGLVPPSLREERAEIVKRGADFASLLGVDRIITHLGFVPEDMHDENYTQLIPVLQDIARYCEELGLDFLFETGQETPVTLLRTIEDIGYDNIGINLDPANLILYGKGNPVDSLYVFGKYVRGVHVKDGVYPTDGSNLGQERSIGKGHVDFPLLLRRLKELGYTGSLVIECELAENRSNHIQEARALLQDWIKEL